MRITAFLLLICFVVLLTGCPKGLSNNVPNKMVIETLVQRNISDFKKDETAYYCYARGYSYIDGKPGSCQESGVTPDVTKYKNDAKILRKKITESFITNIDNVYEQFINDLQTRRSSSSFLADVTELGVGTAIGITNGERAIQILGVALTAFRGGRKSIDLNFYQQQSTPILITKMDTSRARIMSAILVKRDSDADEYSLEEALGDVLRYFWAGTLTRAFVELNKDSSQQAKVAEENLAILKGEPIDAIPTVEAATTAKSIFDQIRNLNSKVTDAANDIEKAKSGTAVEKTTADEKQKAVRKILVNIWNRIEKVAAFSDAIAKVKGDKTYGDIADSIKTTPDTVETKKILSLIKQFSKTLKGDVKVRQPLLDILNEENN